MDEVNIECPILSCVERLEPGVCYRHDSLPAPRLIKGSRCYDKNKASAEDVPMYCPFQPNSGEYMWIDEYLQGQKQKGREFYARSKLVVTILS